MKIKSEGTGVEDLTLFYPVWASVLAWEMCGDFRTLRTLMGEVISKFQYVRAKDLSYIIFLLFLLRKY